MKQETNIPFCLLSVLGIIFVVSIPRDVFQIRYWRAKRKRKRLKNHGNM